MKSPSPSIPAVSALEAKIIGEIADHVTAAENAIRKGCEHAILAGLRLIWLHSNVARPVGTNGHSEAVPHGTPSFDVACRQIGISRRLAYKWIGAAQKAVHRAGLIMPDDDIVAELPAPGTPRWESWEKSLREIAAGSSLNRLMLGSEKPSTEDDRYDHLIGSAEDGQSRAEELLEGVASGKYTLVQAVRALGSLEAYDRLRAEGGEKVRKDPVYLTMDGETGEMQGLFVKSVTTLRNTFQRWEDSPQAVRKQARAMWLELLSTLPSDLKNG